MCQLQDAESDKYVMKITTDFCRQQKAIGRLKSEYIKIAAECLGCQPQFLIQTYTPTSLTGATSTEISVTKDLM